MMNHNRFIRRKNVLVTGGAGFIGSHLVEELVKLGAKVRVIDNFVTGKRDNLIGVISQVELIEGDINDPELVRAAMTNVDFVLHLAAIPSVQRSIDNPVATNQANVSGTLNLLNVAKDLKIKRFVYAASSSVYGDTPTLPKIESMPPNPLSPYAISKYAGELYCKTFNRIYGLETICLRYFNVFGPRQDPASPYSAVIPKFIKALLEDRIPVIYGDGEQTRDFSYVKNVVLANLLAVGVEKTQGEMINIACGQRISLKELVRELNLIMGKNIKPEYLPARLGDVKHSLADVSKAKKILNYHPVVTVEEGLRLLVEWYLK